MKVECIQGNKHIIRMDIDNEVYIIALDSDKDTAHHIENVLLKHTQNEYRIAEIKRNIISQYKNNNVPFVL